MKEKIKYFFTATEYRVVESGDSFYPQKRNILTFWCWDGYMDGYLSFLSFSDLDKAKNYIKTRIEENEKRKISAKIIYHPYP